MTFKRKVAAYFPLVRSACILCFAILTLSCINDPEPVIVGVTLSFGVLSIVSILLTPTTKSDP